MGRLVVVARRLYLARHLFTLCIILYNMNIYPDCGDLSDEVKKQHSLLGHSKVTQIFSKLTVDSDA